MRRYFLNAIIIISIIFGWWLLFGGGALGSPSWGFKALLHITE